MKNRGLNLELEKQHHNGTEWSLGAISIDIARIPLEEREECNPTGERQNIGEEKSTCATMAPINRIERKMNWLIRKEKISAENIEWLYNNGYIVFDD